MKKTKSTSHLLNYATDVTSLILEEFREQFDEAEDWQAQAPMEAIRETMHSIGSLEQQLIDEPLAREEHLKHVKMLGITVISLYYALDLQGRAITETIKHLVSQQKGEYQMNQNPREPQEPLPPDDGGDEPKEDESEEELVEVQQTRKGDGFGDVP